MGETPAVTAFNPNKRPLASVMIDATPRVERLDARMAAIYRSMSSEQRLAACFDATRLVRSRLEAHLSCREGWTPEQVQAEVARRFLLGR